MKRWEGDGAAELPPLTPEALEADDTLTDDEKAQIYDLLFEYHGDDEWEEG